DNLFPRWGEGTEFRSVRYKHYKYVYFRDAEPLFFDLDTDPEEQVNLVGRELDKEGAETLAFIEKWTRESIDFDEAEKERTVRDSDLGKLYPRRINGRHAGNAGNIYVLPSGKVVDGDTVLYSPVVHAENPGELFADYPGK
ncbi:MAG: hypothetical protein JXR97_05445, partial [Planctomycetes bacterium]|nr:hypothetical protein [Planctomycetota bacterium]